MALTDAHTDLRGRPTEITAPLNGAASGPWLREATVFPGVSPHGKMIFGSSRFCNRIRPSDTQHPCLYLSLFGTQLLSSQTAASVLHVRVTANINWSLAVPPLVNLSCNTGRSHSRLRHPAAVKLPSARDSASHLNSTHQWLVSGALMDFGENLATPQASQV